MTHRLMTQAFSVQLMENEQRKPLTHKVKLYSLFHSDNNHRWIRVSDNAYSELLAYRVFTSRLSKEPLKLSIRPIKFYLLRYSQVEFHTHRGQWSGADIAPDYEKAK